MEQNILLCGKGSNETWYAMSNEYVEHEEILICLMDFSWTSLYNGIMLKIQDDLTTINI